MTYFQQKRGQLLISLMYVPLEGRLVLGVIKASNLRAMDINGSSGNAFVCIVYSLTTISRSLYKNLAPLSWSANRKKENSG